MSPYGAQNSNLSRHTGELRPLLKCPYLIDLLLLSPDRRKVQVSLKKDLIIITREDHYFSRRSEAISALWKM